MYATFSSLAPYEQGFVRRLLLSGRIQKCKDIGNELLYLFFMSFCQTFTNISIYIYSHTFPKTYILV